MKTKFTWQLKYLVELNATLEIEDPLHPFDDSQDSKQSNSPHKRISLKQLSPEQRNEAQNLSPKINRSLETTVILKSAKTTGQPITPKEIQLYALNGYSSEITYIKANFETAIKDAIMLLIEQGVAERSDFYELAPEEDEELRYNENIPDEYKINKEDAKKKLTSKAGSLIRKRLNPNKIYKPKKTDKEIELSKLVAIEELKPAIKLILADKDLKFIKAEVARKLGICGITPKTKHTGYMNSWLRNRKMTWDEVVELKKSYELKNE